MQDLGNRKSFLYRSSAMWQYGPSGELTDVRNASFTGATISRYAYTYDAALRRTAVAKSGRAFATEDDISYGYNHRSELTNATAQADATYRYAYDFDDIGNRKTSAEHAAPSVSYTANSLNQYTAIDDFVPTYDADGNQTLVKTKTGIWHVTYNGENRPVRWECGTNTITMTYDRMGRRISKNDQTFIYDGYLQIADNRGSCYIWDPTEPVATRPLVRNNSEFYFHDGNKNVSDILSVTGSVLSHYDYAPFGDCTAVGSNPWRFSSEYSDDDLGLIYYNYRHYDPVTGRWLGRDDIIKRIEGLYSYLRNMPLVYSDALGLCNVGDITNVEMIIEYKKGVNNGLNVDAAYQLYTNVSIFATISSAVSVTASLQSGMKAIITTVVDVSIDNKLSKSYGMDAVMGTIDGILGTMAKYYPAVRGKIKYQECVCHNFLGYKWTGWKIVKTRVSEWVKLEGCVYNNDIPSGEECYTLEQAIDIIYDSLKSQLPASLTLLDRPYNKGR